jgi:uncharacterized membrane protein
MQNGNRFFGIMNKLDPNTKLFRARMCVFTSVVFLGIIHRPSTVANAQKSIIVLTYRRYVLLGAGVA